MRNTPACLPLTARAALLFLFACMSIDQLYRAFASKPFTFIVQGTSLYVHSALVSECSKPLDRMINGDLSEAKQGFAVLEDVDRATFVRFIRWIYTRDYPAPEHIYFDTGDEEEVGSKKAKKMIKEEKIEAPKNTLRESFITRDNPLSSTWKSGLGNSTPSARGNKGPQEDYTEVRSLLPTSPVGASLSPNPAPRLRSMPTSYSVLLMYYLYIKKANS